MVKTRANLPFLRTLRSGNGRGKNIGNREENEPSSDESGLETKPLPSKRRRLRSSEAFTSHGYPSLEATVPLATVPLTRSTRQSLRILNGTTRPVETRNSQGRRKGVRVSRSVARRESKRNNEMLDESDLIRRSERKRRKVYDTLNVHMLTDHRYLMGYENTKSPKKKAARKRYSEEESDSQTEEDTVVQTPSMYDLVKRKHDQTPTPEKRSTRSSRHQGEAEDSDEEDDEEDDDDDDDNDDEDDDDDEEEEEEDAEGGEGKDYKGYSLRQKRPIPNRYTAPPMKSSKGKRGHFHMTVRQKSGERKKPNQYASPLRKMRRHKRKAINMSSSTSSSDDSDNEKDERKFEKRKAKSMAKARDRCLPMNFTNDDAASGILKERARIGSSLADVDPMNIDRKVMFDAVGGLNKQIRALKEMVLFPLMYPEVFEKFKISPPRGVLFHGPPGTGKTLVARALANECSQGDKKVAFFMRKGADCLSKWVGESERQLRLLFDQAFSMRPAIIFFDEIDGLAPVRSSRQDQIHSSIVSTLLALMDGLDSRGEIVVIGATNRIDAIDPALRRPGRFDREFQFALPDKNARRSIFSIHTREWEPKLLPSFISEVADRCVGYCGADIKALCTEAALFALRRRYPQIYNSTKKLLVDVNSIEVTAKDFQKAMKTIVPASQRSVVSPARALSPLIWPLLKKALTEAAEIVEKVFPPAHIKTVTESSPCSLLGNPSSSRNDQRNKTAAVLSDEEASSDDDLGPPIFESLPGSSRSERYMRRLQQFSGNPETSENHYSSFFSSLNGPARGLSTYRPRFLICGRQGMGQSTHVAPALLHTMEHLTVYCLDLPALYGVTSKTPEEACSQLFREARRTSPCVVYSPHFDALWNATGDSLHATLLSLLHDLPPLAPVLFLATADESWVQLPVIMRELFSDKTGQVFQVADPTSDERRAFFNDLFLGEAVKPPKPAKSKKNCVLEVLPFAPTPPPRQLTEAELKKVRQDEENTMRELRIFLRDVHAKLMMDRRFKEFSKPVDLLEVPDYLEVIEDPMDLATMLHRIDCHYYSTCAQYLADVDLITSNALKYNPDRDPLDKLIRHRACELSDSAHSLIKSQLEPEFEKTCEEIIASRERRANSAPKIRHRGQSKKLFLKLPLRRQRKLRINPGEKTTAIAPPFVFTDPATQGNSSSTLNTQPAGSAKEALGVSDITFVSESQSQNNSTEQKKKPRRRKAPIYWGKRPSRKKTDAKRKLDSDLDLSQKQNELAENGDSEQSDAEDLAANSNCGKPAEEDSGKFNEAEKAVVVDGDLECEYRDANHKSVEDNIMHLENGGDSLVNGDVVLLDNAIPTEICPEVNSKSVLQSDVEEISQLPEKTLKNHVLDKMDTNVLNGLATEGCSEEIMQDRELDCTGDEAFNDLPNSQLEKSPQSQINPTENELEISVEGNSCSSQLADDLKEKLEVLLDLLVDSSKGASMEMLERYYSALQSCIHKQRHSHDKTQLLKDLEIMIEGFGPSQTQTRTF